MSTMMEGSRSNRRSTAKDAHAEMFRKTSVHEVPQELMLSIRSKFSNNYFGLPPYSMQQTPSALAYMCRKPLDLEPDEEDADLESNSEVLIKTERVDTSHRRTHDLSSDHPKHDQYAQRKVASALLIMAKNPLMRKHFLSKGGYEAALKLIADSKDPEVLHFCGQCLIQVSMFEENAHVIVEKGIFNGISYFCEASEELLRLMAAVVIALLSSAPAMDELLVMSNALMYIQSLMTHCHRADSICHLLLALSNISPSIMGSDAEVAMRLCFQATKKIDFSRSAQRALFISDVYNNFSRLNHYSSLLVDEGILPLLLHMIDIYLVEPDPTNPIHSLYESIINRCTEALSNLSINRKNRREIAGCGIASRMANLFEKGSHSTCACVLLLLGNLLSSNLFHDKVANVTVITNMLDNLFDIHFTKQFNAVCYCLCQLSKNILSCEILVQCKVIPIVVGYLHNCPADSIDYLWTVVHTITQFPQFFQDVMDNNALIIHELYEEIKFETSSPHQLLSVCKIALNLTQYKQFHQYVEPSDLETFIKTMKIVLSSGISSSYIQMMSLVTLINLARYCHESRGLILGTDLIDLFTQIGIDDDYINVKYAELLHLISNEESCCYRLLDMNVQRFLISLQDSFQRLLQGHASYKKPERKYIKGQSIANLNAFLNGGNGVMNTEAMARSMQAISTINQLSHPAGAGGAAMQLGMGGNLSMGSTASSLDGMNASFHAPNTAAVPPTLVHNINSINLSMITNHLDPVAEGEYGKALTAATLHNIALKRPVLSPGALTMILYLAKNCKTLRVLHCIRTLAHMSIYNKSKIILSKEFKKVIPMLTVIMRCGCEEAEKVQYYCAIILCNILSLTLDKTLLLELVQSNAITDLMVVTLLRINNLNTKETLAKTFYNLLGRVEIRELLVMNMDILSAILELLKLEYNDLFELCVRALYNISCELRAGSGSEIVYANRFSQLKITSIVINRLLYSPNMVGNVPTRPIRLLLGMTMANMSFNKQLVLEMIQANQAASGPNSTFGITTASSSSQPVPQQTSDVGGISSSGPSLVGTSGTVSTVQTMQGPSTSSSASPPHSQHSSAHEARHSRSAGHGHHSAHHHHHENKLSDALYRVFALHADESVYCSIATLYNLSKLPECRILADSKAIPLCVEIIQGDSNVLNIQLAVSVLCNFSTLVVFHEQLTQVAVSALVKVLNSPTYHLSIKVDVIQCVYNIIVSYPQSCTVFVQCELIAALWKMLKLFGGSTGGNKAAAATTGGTATSAATAKGGGGSGAAATKTAVDDDEASLASGLTAGSAAGPSPSKKAVGKGGKGGKGEASGAGAAAETTAIATGPATSISAEVNDEDVYILISHIIRLLCVDVTDNAKLNKMLQDGIMNILLKLAKLEITPVKVDMSFSIYALAKGMENVKLLKRDAIDIIFWLTIHDTLAVQNLIHQNIARALRSFSITSDEALLLIKQERFINIIKLLVKSKHEDILWQTAGILYNLMQYEMSLKKLLSFGLISFIFEIAACDFVHVKHVCSACLHIVPEHLPNMEDPLVLELILSLLDAQGDKFSEVSMKPHDNLEYPYPTLIHKSTFVHTFTSFVASWTPFTCLLDTSFIPAILPSHINLQLYNSIDIPPVDPAQVNTTEKHGKLHPKAYNDFNVDLTWGASGGSPTAAAATTGGNGGVTTGGGAGAAGTGVGGGGEILSVPPVIGREPPIALTNEQIMAGGLTNPTIQVMSDFATTPTTSRPQSTNVNSSEASRGPTSTVPSNRSTIVRTPNQLLPLQPLSAAGQSGPPSSSRMSMFQEPKEQVMLPSLLSASLASSKTISTPLLSTPAPLPQDTLSAINSSIRSRAGRSTGSRTRGGGFSSSDGNTGIGNQVSFNLSQSLPHSLHGMQNSHSRSQLSQYTDSFVTQESSIPMANFSYKAAAMASPPKPDTKKIKKKDKKSTH